MATAVQDWLREHYAKPDAKRGSPTDLDTALAEAQRAQKGYRETLDAHLRGLATSWEVLVARIPYMLASSRVVDRKCEAWQAQHANAARAKLRPGEVTPFHQEAR
jgi:hypothetical protein